MHPIHDADVLVLLALAVASKRKSANLNELVLGLAMVQAQLPSVTRLMAAFTRLSSHGLITGDAEGYRLSETAQKLMLGVSRKKESAEQIFSLREKLKAFTPDTSEAAFQPEEQQLTAAIAAWQASLPPLTKSDKFALRKGLQPGEQAKKRPWVPGGGKPFRGAGKPNPRRRSD